jgi:hypothetical protein
MLSFCRAVSPDCVVKILSAPLLAIIFILVGCGSANTHPAVVAISATPSITIHPGDQNVPVGVSLGVASVQGPYDVTIAGLPPGITVNSVSLSPGQSGVLTLSATTSADIDGFASLGAAGDTKSVSIVATAGSVQATVPLALTISLSNPTFSPAPSQINLPIVSIDTAGVPIADKVTNVPGTITITSADGQTAYLPSSTNTDNTATFHLHGNSTVAMPKKPYHFKLTTSLDLLATMGLACPYGSKGKNTCDKSKTYDLLANYDDKTFLRDWAASALANAIPIGAPYLNSPANSPSPGKTLMPWAPHSLFVELYLNGQYQGNYQLIEEIKVDSHRVNIAELSQTDTAPADITGGYLMEIDNHYKDEDVLFTTPQNMTIAVDDPDFSPDPQVPSQVNYITNYMTSAEDSLYANNFTDPTLGWRAYFDEASAINFYIVNDVMGNSDGGQLASSDYLYKDANNPLIYMGPVWDFDISSGNGNYTAITNPTVPWMQTHGVWYARWFQDPGFKADVIAQWNALKSNGIFDQWIASIQQQAATLQQSQQNNFGRWPMRDVMVWPNPQASGSYQGEVSYLINWINLRIAYLDSQFNGKSPTTTSLDTPSAALRTGSPATLTAHVLPAGVNGTVSYLASGVVVGTAALDGTGTANLTTSNLPSGNISLQAVFNGNSTAGLSASNPTNVSVLGQLTNTSTSISRSISSTDAHPSFVVSVQGSFGDKFQPSGTIQFTANGVNIGSANLSAAHAVTFTPSHLPPGAVSIQASYNGDINHRGSASGAISLDIPAPQ